MEDGSSIYNVVTLLLAEKRTSLSVLRTAIAIFTLPLSVFTILIATSRYYDIGTSLYFILPLVLICALLVVFGLYLIVRSLKKIADIDHKIHEIKMKEECVRDIIEE